LVRVVTLVPFGERVTFKYLDALAERIEADTALSKSLPVLPIEEEEKSRM
jgi:hypothetical protein